MISREIYIEGTITLYESEEVHVANSAVRIYDIKVGVRSHPDRDRGDDIGTGEAEGGEFQSTLMSALRRANVGSHLHEEKS